MIVCAFWTVVLLFDLLKNGNRGAHLQLFHWTFAATLLYAGHIIYFSRSMYLLPVFDSIYVSCNLAVFPLYMRYLLYLTEGRVEKWQTALIIIPPLAFGIATGVLYMLMSQEEIKLFTDTYLYNNSFKALSGLTLAQALLHHIGKILFAVGVVITLITGIMKVNKYNRMVDSIFADNDDKRLHNITSILVFMAITCMISFAANAIGKHFFYNSTLLLFVPFVLFTIILFALGYTGYKQVFSYEDMIAVASAEVNAQQETTNINKCMPRQDKLAERIISLAEDTTFFCSPNLRVSNLANLLGTNTRYVQKALNEEIGMSLQSL